MKGRWVRIALGTGLLLAGVIACSNNKPPESEEQRAQRAAESLQQQQAQREQVQNSQDPFARDPNSTQQQPSAQPSAGKNPKPATKAPNPGVARSTPVVTVPRTPVITGVGGRLPLLR